MPRASPKIRFAALPALLFAGGLATAFYYGDLWAHLPSYSEAEIEQSVDLNLALERARRQPAPASEVTDEAQQRATIRAALLRDIEHERHDVQLHAVIGCSLSAMGLGWLSALRRRAAAQ